MNWPIKINQLKIWGHHWGWLILPAMISLGQFERLSILGFPFYAHELVMLVWMVWSITKDAKKYSLNKTAATICFLTLTWIGIGWLANGYQPTQVLKPILYLVRILFYAGFALVLKQTPDLMTKQNLRYGALVAGMLLTWYGILQLIFLPDLRFLAAFGYDDHLSRLASTIFDPTYTGLLMVITYFLLQKYSLPKLVKWLLNCVLILAIYFTYSRSVYLAFLAVLIMSEITAKVKIHHKFLGMIIILLSLVGFALIPTPAGEGGKLFRIETIFARIRTTQQTLIPLTGYKLFIGSGLFLSVREESNQVRNLDIANRANIPDNIIVAILSGVGLVGLVGAAYLLLKLLLQTNQQDKGIFLALIATLIHAQFNNDLTQPHVLAVISMMLASLNEQKLKSKLN